MLRNDQLDQWDREAFFHPSTHLAQHARGEAPNRVIQTAKGCHITDRDGNELLDAFAGLYCVNVGYGRPEIAEAIAASHAFSVAGGGDTLAAIDKYGVADDISYISTGGGAFLEFVEGKKLPAVAILEERAAEQG